MENVIVVTEKFMKAIEPRTTDSYWRKLCSDVHDLTGFTTDPIKKTMRDYGCGKKKVAGKGFQDIDLGEIQESTDTT